MKLHDISAKVITNLDLRKESRPDCIPIMFLKNCELVLSCILAELFNICLRESFFPRFLEGLISGPCIKECWGKVCS